MDELYAALVPGLHLAFAVLLDQSEHARRDISNEPTQMHLHNKTSSVYIDKIVRFSKNYSS